MRAKHQISNCIKIHQNEYQTESNINVAEHIMFIQSYNRTNIRCQCHGWKGGWPHNWTWAEGGRGHQAEPFTLTSSDNVWPCILTKPKVCDLSFTILLVTFLSIGFSRFFVFRVVLLCRFVQISTPKATTDGWKSVATSGSNSWA